MYDKKRAQTLLISLGSEVDDAIKSGCSPSTVAVAVAGLIRALADMTEEPSKTINSICDLAAALGEVQ